MIGLFTFFQALSHVAAYTVDKEFFWDEILKDVTQRPFIVSGMIALVSMLPLAATSTKKWIVRLGGSRWQALHRLVYLSGIAGVIHYYFNEKSDIRDRYLYIAILVVLLGVRGWHAWRGKRGRGGRPLGAAPLS